MYRLKITIRFSSKACWDKCVDVEVVYVGVEYGQHALYTDSGPTRGQRCMSCCKQGTDLFRRHGQHRQGICVDYVIIITIIIVIIIIGC